MGGGPGGLPTGDQRGVLLRRRAADRLRRGQLGAGVFPQLLVSVCRSSLGDQPSTSAASLTSSRRQVDSAGPVCSASTRSVGTPLTSMRSWAMSRTLAATPRPMLIT
ncbi:hypothetical protein [Micromonospora sp. NPDC049107]|uniref:hypothetical protein n=1 Tax=Micromonospora sp. NPDC049107 TaxID=3154349 RepID=UPI00340F87D7